MKYLKGLKKLCVWLLAIRWTIWFTIGLLGTVGAGKSCFQHSLCITSTLDRAGKLLGGKVISTAKDPKAARLPRNAISSFDGTPFEVTKEGKRKRKAQKIELVVFDTGGEISLLQNHSQSVFQHGSYRISDRLLADEVLDKARFLDGALVVVNGTSLLENGKRPLGDIEGLLRLYSEENGNIRKIIAISEADVIQEKLKQAESAHASRSVLANGARLHSSSPVFNPIHSQEDLRRHMALAGDILRDIPCPSEYKRLTGEKYRNNHRLESTTYWTYATIHRILQNEMYIGNMEQGRDDRLQMHGKAKRKDRSQWTVVSDTHQPIIEKDQWQRVQALLNANARTPDFQQNVSPFAGFLKCGDCGRAMVKTTWGGKTFYTCGSYKRYGASVCSKHYIAHDSVAKVVLDDLNRLMAAVENLRQLAQQGAAQHPSSNGDPQQKLEAALQHIQRRRQSAYEDYQDALISKEDFLRYRADYDAQEQALQAQLDKLRGTAQDDPLCLPWVKELLASGQLAELDRPTVAAAIREIRVYEGNRMEIDYLLPEGCRALLEG